MPSNPYSRDIMCNLGQFVNVSSVDPIHGEVRHQIRDTGFTREQERKIDKIVEVLQRYEAENYNRPKYLIVDKKHYEAMLAYSLRVNHGGISEIKEFMGAQVIVASTLNPQAVGSPEREWLRRER